MNCSGCTQDLGGFDQRTAFISVEVAGDERLYSYWWCSGCGFYTLEIYRDAFMGGSSASVSDPLEEAEGKPAVERIRTCPEPGNKRCRCEAHQAFGGQP